MTEPDLESIKQAAARLRAAEASAAEERARLHAAIVRAVSSGASYSEAGRAAGYSRQRVTQIVRGD